MSYIVKAPLVVARKTDGSDVYLYEGAPVPPDLKDGEVKRLAAEGFLEKADAAKLTAPQKPAGNAGQAKWLEYARAIGADVSDTSSKDELVAAVEAKEKADADSSGSNQ